MTSFGNVRIKKKKKKLLTNILPSKQMLQIILTYYHVRNNEMICIPPGEIHMT